MGSGEFAGLLASQILALSGQESEAQVPPLTIRVVTHLVLVDVVVTDKGGKPVADLKPQDFHVEENGRAQKIAVFSSPLESLPGTTRAQAAGPSVITPSFPKAFYENVRAFSVRELRVFQTREQAMSYLIGEDEEETQELAPPA